MLTSRRRRRAEMLISLPLLQILLQILGLFLRLLLGLLRLVYLLHAPPDPAPRHRGHAGQRDTGGHREYGEPTLHAHGVLFMIHSPVHPTLAPSAAGSFHWRFNSE